MISSIRPFSYVAEAPSGATQPPADAPSAPDAPEPVDTPPSSEPPAERKDGIAYRAFRGVVGGVAGFGGGLVGATAGGVKGAFSDGLVMGPMAHRAIRGGGALAGLASGVYLGSSFGPVGIVLGALGGPLVGAAAGSALIGGIEGGGAALCGAVHGATTGASRSWTAATEGLDTLAGKQHNEGGSSAEASTPSAPATTDTPQPPTEESVPYEMFVP